MSLIADRLAYAGPPSVRRARVAEIMRREGPYARRQKRRQPMLGRLARYGRERACVQSPGRDEAAPARVLHRTETLAGL